MCVRQTHTHAHTHARTHAHTHTQPDMHVSVPVHPLGISCARLHREKMAPRSVSRVSISEPFL